MPTYFLPTPHCLPVSSRITFIILLYIFKILNGQTPGYLTELLSYYKPTRCLRSSSDTTHLVPHSSATAIGDKRFQIVAAEFWNLSPIEIRTVTSVVTFKKLLKTYLFWLCCLCFVFFVSAMVLRWMPSEYVVYYWAAVKDWKIKSWKHWKK